MSIEEEIKQTRFRTPHQKAIVNLIFTTNRLAARQQDFFRPYGITTQQYNILRILRGQYPARISGEDIKSRMLDQNSDMSRLIRRLLSKNLVDKMQNPIDRRAAAIGITPAGLDILADIDKKLENTEGELIRLSADEANLLSSLLDKSRG